jgi:hypothetical protein
MLHNSTIIYINNILSQIENNKNISEFNMSILGVTMAENYDKNFILLKNVSEALIEGGTFIFFVCISKYMCMFVQIHIKL